MTSKTMSIPKAQEKQFALLAALSILDTPKMPDLGSATGISSKRTVLSMMANLSEINVLIDRVHGKRHGYYQLKSSGPYDIDSIKEILEEKSPEAMQRIFEHARKKLKAVSITNVSSPS